MTDSITQRPRDLVCLGRAAVDLYGEQLGGRLEDMQTFAKYLGGSPANTAVGAARLGLRVGMISRVGDEHNGRFVRETLQSEKVDVTHLRTDPHRLTALVFLGIQDPNTFPLVFYRHQCADMGLVAADIDPDYIASAHALLVSGTHLSHPDTREACVAAMHFARDAGTRVVLDIDYRPVLWGLTAPGLGEQRYVSSAEVSARIQQVLPLCDLVVGTEEEVQIAGASGDVATALHAVRAATDALIVMKRGPMGCVAYAGPIPDELEDGLVGPGFPVEVFNVLGAGDAFMAGLLRGWVRHAPLEQALRYANACGALVVSRHGCAPAMPSWAELTAYLKHGSAHHRLRQDRWLEHVHRASTRTAQLAPLAILAFDHRSLFETLAAHHHDPADKIAAFKTLVLQAASIGYRTAQSAADASSVGQDFPDAGIIADERFATSVLQQASRSGIWIGRPVELPGSRPLVFEQGEDIALALRTWPRGHIVKCLLSHHPDDEAELARAQIATVARLAAACQATGHELLLELIPPGSLPCNSDTVARGVLQIYAAGIRPDWWKLPPPDARGWSLIAHAIAQHDPYCRGVLLLGLEASEERLEQGFRASAGQALCKGFAVGRTLFADAATAWFAGKMDDAAVVADISARYQRLIGLWQSTRAKATIATPEISDPKEITI